MKITSLVWLVPVGLILSARTFSLQEKKHALGNQYLVWADWKKSRRWWVTGAETKTIYWGLWGLCFSFSLAASGWLHLRLQGTKMMKNKAFFFFIHQEAAASWRVSCKVILLLPPHFSTNHISTFMLCSITTAPFPKPPEGISCVLKACALLESRIFAPAAMEEHHMVTESNIRNRNCLLLYYFTILLILYKYT